LTNFRYHGKCLKIARGKVKEEEKYTCPICDWRVKIPRDAARPKLEDLQSWQDEIPGLPFQPDEEQILDKIINNAQEFRQHVAPFCNPMMATADEADTQRFYLRKIEGAEILLAYETNFFRQELHKWSPVAPDPPPILEASKSTRKPRPTKLQKLMAQHGVDDPEALPQNLRTKPHTFKRKESDPSGARPHALQPAPGRSDSGTPTNNSFPPPPGHPGPVLSGLHDGSTHAHPSHWGEDRHGPFAMTMSPRDGPREAFTPHAFMHSGGMQSPGFGAPVSPRPSGGMFNERGFGGIDGAVLGSVDSPIRDTFPGAPPAASQDVARMFDDLTNQDGEDEHKVKVERSGGGDSKWDEDDDMGLLFDGP
jgi:histone demethylase JARID1